MTHSKSLCKRKSVKNPNRCKKVSGCKVALGTKRTFCRKTKNTRKGKYGHPKTRKVKALRRTKAEKLQDKLMGKRSDKEIRELRKLM